MSLILAAAAMIVPAGQTFTCTPTRVWDGDGPVWCEEGPKIRLAGIATREINNTCQKTQPCPDGDALEARDYLVQLVGKASGTIGQHILVEGPPMTCLSTGGSYERTTAWCVSPKGGDLSCAMVASPYALIWRKHWKDHSCPTT